MGAPAFPVLRTRSTYATRVPSDPQPLAKHSVAAFRSFALPLSAPGPTLAVAALGHLQ
jgi:hypothetical protein